MPHAHGRDHTRTCARVQVHFLGDVSAGADAPFVLFLHDDTKDVTPELWAKCGSLLASKGYRWMAPYLPGFGPTPGKKAGLKPDAVAAKGGPAELALAILDHVGVEKAHVVARENSNVWGLLVLKAYPTRVHRLVMMQKKPFDLSLPDHMLMALVMADVKKDKTAAAVAKKGSAAGLFWAAENRGKHDPSWAGSASKSVAKGLEKKYKTTLTDIYKDKEDELWEKVFSFLDTGKV